jgi:hypothetical protein
MHPNAGGDPTAGAGKPQTLAVLVLSLVLAGLLTLWLVGGFLLFTRAPANFGVPPNATASPSVSR